MNTVDLPIGTTRMLATMLAVALLAFATATAGAQVQANIERGLPLSFEDTVPQEYMGRELQLVNRYERTDDGKDRWRFEPRLELGVWQNTQLTLSTPFLFGNADEGDGLGPIEVDLLYNINQETLRLPVSPSWPARSSRVRRLLGAGTALIPSSV